MKRLNSIDLLYQNFKIYINNDRKKMLALIILNYYVYEKVTYSNSLHKKFILLWNYYKKEIIESKKKSNRVCVEIIAYENGIWTDTYFNPPQYRRFKLPCTFKTRTHIF